MVFAMSYFYVKNTYSDFDLEMEKFIKYFSFIAAHCIYDQLLFEYNRCGIFWIHVSLRRDEKNRRMRIENYPTKH